MTETDAVLVERDGPVTIVSINRPHCRNAVDGATARKLYDAFLAFDADAEASVAVFTGTGGYFCAGADLKAVAAGDPNKKREIGGHDSIAPMGPSRLRLSKPVIAAVEGFAVAGGMELALWADMRVVAEDATFGVFCRRFGVPLIDLGTIRLPRLIGHSQAIDLILTGRPVGGPEALRMGLANRLVPKGETRAQAIALAKEIARFPQTCLRADRLSALRQWDLAEEDAIANEMRGGLEVIASGETLSGATRFASGVGRHGAFGESDSSGRRRTANREMNRDEFRRVRDCHKNVVVAERRRRLPLATGVGDKFARGQSIRQSRSEAAPQRFNDVLGGSAASVLTDHLRPVLRAADLRRSAGALSVLRRRRHLHLIGRARRRHRARQLAAVRDRRPGKFHRGDDGNPGVVAGRANDGGRSVGAAAGAGPDHARPCQPSSPASCCAASA